VNHVVHETVNDNLIVKGFGRQRYEQERFIQNSLENLRRGLKMVAVQLLNIPAVQLIMSIILSLVMCIALHPQILCNTSASEFVAYITAAGMLARPIKALTDINEKIQRGMAAAHSVFELLDMPEEKNTGTLTDSLKGDIEFKDVNLIYEDGHHAIH